MEFEGQVVHNFMIISHSDAVTELKHLNRLGASCFVKLYFFRVFRAFVLAIGDF